VNRWVTPRASAGALDVATSNMAASHRTVGIPHGEARAGRLPPPAPPAYTAPAMLKTSPFHARTAPLVRAQTWRRWAGYQMASAYDPHPDREYAAIRNAAALLDVSPLFKYRITGRDAARLLDRMVTRDVVKLAVGQ